MKKLILLFAFLGLVLPCMTVQGKEDPKTVDMVPNSQNSLSIYFFFTSPE